MSQQSVGNFLKSLDENEALRKQFDAAVAEEARNPENVVAFGKKHGFDFTEKDLEMVVKSVSTESGELSEDQLKSVAGGIIIVGGSFSTSLLRSIARYSTFNIQ